VRLLVLPLLAALVLAACGDEGFAEDEDRLPAAALGKVTDALEDVRALCVQGPPEPRAIEQSFARLIDVVDQYPDRIAQGGEARRTRPVLDIALTAADNLERCGRPGLAQRVRESVEAAA